MPPDRGRASRACSACRKQKTRCYESARGSACLRCERIGQHCSLEVDIGAFIAHQEGQLSDANATQNHDGARYMTTVSFAADLLTKEGSNAWRDWSRDCRVELRNWNLQRPGPTTDAQWKCIVRNSPASPRYPIRNRRLWLFFVKLLRNLA